MKPAGTAAVPGSPGPIPFRLVERLERWPVLDGPARVVAAAGTKIVRRGPLKDALSGTWLGHALHPMLTDFPLGMWMSASVLDLVGGRVARPPARRLIGLGLAAAVPTAAAGLADWLDTSGKERRVGIVHAATNSSALALYGASYLARRQGRHPRAVALGLVGGLTATLGGYLGGHLSLARGVGVDHTAFEDGPEEWTEARLADPPDGTATVTDSGLRLLVADQGNEVVALSDRCTHRGGPLHEGRIEGDCVTCPWHGSRFRLEDGAIVEGPATAPQPAYRARYRAGRLEVRRRLLQDSSS